MLYVFTSCALNYLPSAKVLAASIRQHMPDARVVLALADRVPTSFRLEDEGFDEVLGLEDFADEVENPFAWAFGHTVMELATALKPFVADRLLARADCDGVMFFDPDCVLFGDMAGMRAALQAHSVVLTPHASLMHERDDWLFFERNPLKVGSFNLGFFGLQASETGRAVARWWKFRLRRLCMDDPAQGLFTDQKWMDLLPGYLDDLKVMRDPVYNLARWNSFQRQVSRLEDRLLIDGEPAQFIHFSGFSKIGPYVQGLYDNTSAPLIDDLGILQDLSRWYAGELKAVCTRPEYTAPWALGRYSNGEAIDVADRRAYRSDPALAARFPDPFDAARLDSYWLYRRRVTRAEAETRFAETVPDHALLNRSVQAHNTILRRHIRALEDQLARRPCEPASTPDAPSGHVDIDDRLRARALALLSDLGDQEIAEAFPDAARDQGFDPEAYLAANPDVGDSPNTPLEHFLRYGLAEGREYPGGTAAHFLEANIDTIERLIDGRIAAQRGPRPWQAGGAEILRFIGARR